jgi:hypothetical protein
MGCPSHPIACGAPIEDPRFINVLMVVAARVPMDYYERSRLEAMQLMLRFGLSR